MQSDITPADTTQPKIKPAKKVDKKKKKTSHFFEIYISKVLKQVTEKNGITSNAKQQLNSALCIFVKHISNIVLELVTIAKKKTITVKEIENALKIVLPGELLTNCISEGEKACSEFTIDDKKGSSRQSKAKIIFPPSVVEKFLRHYGNFKIMVAYLSPVYLAAVLEYLTADILDVSADICKSAKRTRITVRDMELAVRNDIELVELFNKLNLSFLGGGVVPYIHQSLLKKYPKKKSTATKKGRFRHGTIAIRNIKKQQKNSDTLIFARSSFAKLVRHVLKNNTDETVKVSKDVFIVLQNFMEQYIVNLLKNANFLAIHAGRVKLTSVDIDLLNHFLNRTENPYTTDVNNDELLSINEDDHELVVDDLVEDNEEDNDDNEDNEEDDENNYIEDIDDIVFNEDDE